MFGQRLIISVVCAGLVTLTVQDAVAAESRLSRESLPIKHTLFEQWQGNNAAAYRVAEYYKLKNLETPELRLAQAAASLELGYLAHGRDLINDLDERSLLPENQSRLHLYLARDAYRRRDWPLLEQHLDALIAFKPDNRYYYFLQAEAARQANRTQQAEQLLAQLDSDDVLRFYGLFNLATSVAADHEIASRLLLVLIDLPAADYEQRMLSERARIALADLYVSNGDPNAARSTLAWVTASEQYGPLALARLARLDMQEQLFENAAAIWYHLTEHYPWHRAAAVAPAGLGYALLQSQGEEAAYGAYLTGLQRIQQQQVRLKDFRQTLKVSMQDANWMVAGKDSEHQLLDWLSTGLGHDDWTSWLADDSVRVTVLRWQSLNDADFELQLRQQDLNILSAVDTEQQRRVISAERAVSGQGLDSSLQQLKSKITDEIADLGTLTTDISGPIERFATDEERALLQELAMLAQSPAAKHYHSRLDRLVGLVRFSIYDAIPVVKQQQISVLEQRLAEVHIASARIQRIQSAAQQLASTNSVGGQISLLTADADALAMRTKQALGSARQTLIAGLTEFIDRDEAVLANQVHGLQYDITRLVDRQVAEVQP